MSSPPVFLPIPVADSDLIRLCMEYASHVWGSSTHTELLNKFEVKAFSLIDSFLLTSCLQPLTLRSNVSGERLVYRVLGLFSMNFKLSPTVRLKGLLTQ